MIEREYLSGQMSVPNLMYRVYAWMGIGLSITAVAAYAVAATPSLLQMLATNGLLLLALLFVQFGLVVVLSMFLTRLSFTTAVALFLLYSLLTGVTLSSLFIIFTTSSIFATFIVTAGMFAIMSLYGYFTNADLSTMGNILFMALIGLILSMLVNLFLQNSIFELIISGVGVIVFSLLTAYDTQRIKLLAQQLSADKETLSKVALFGALALYLDFLNLFLFLLRFTGARRQD